LRNGGHPPSRGTSGEVAAPKESRRPPEKQSNFCTDEITKGDRELSIFERERIADIFKEMALGSLEDKKDVNWNLVTIPWAEIAKRFRFKLSPQHIQRMSIYLKWNRQHIRLGGYLERVGMLLTAGTEKRLRMCFGILDVDGDCVLGTRDIFAALKSCKNNDNVDLDDSNDNTEVVNVSIVSSGSIGIDFPEISGAALEVGSVVKDSPAELQGVSPGDRLAHINGLDVNCLSADEIRNLLVSPARPLQLRFLRSDKGKETGNIFSLPDFEKLLRALGDRERITTRLRVTIVSARGLRNADIGSKSDPYCVVEIPGKAGKAASKKFETKVKEDNLDPVWKEEVEITDYMAGESLRFIVKDKDIGSKADESLGYVNLNFSDFRDGGFDGELKLKDAGKGIVAMLRVKVLVLGEGGIRFSDFAEIFSSELSFYAPLIDGFVGAGFSAAQAQAAIAAKTQKNPVKLKVTISEAHGLRNADPGGKSDPYCVIDIPGRPLVKHQTKVINDTLDPIWREKKEVPEFIPGDQLRFSIYDKDAGVTKDDDLIGQATLTSSMFYPTGFEGQVQLTDTGGHGDYNPTLLLKITVPTSGAQLSANLPVSPRDGNGAAATARGDVVLAASLTARKRHRCQLEEMRSVLPHLDDEEANWYMYSFEALCGPELEIRRSPFVAITTRLFGIPCGLLSGRLFDMASQGRRSSALGVLAWAQLWDRYHGRAKHQTQARGSLAFDLYDLDGDGVIGVCDAMTLAKEVERLAVVLGFPPENPSDAICEEMQYVYSLIAENTDSTTSSGVICDLFLFMQVRPHPVVADLLLNRLDALVETEEARRPEARCYWQQQRRRTGSNADVPSGEHG